GSRPTASRSTPLRLKQSFLGVARLCSGRPTVRVHASCTMGSPRRTGTIHMSCQFNRLPLWTLAGVLSSAAPVAAWACATCGCTLSADAAAGYSAMPGLRFNFEYDYINQNWLRSGTSLSDPGDVKIIGSYQGWLPTHNLGVQLGVKLPTGHYGTAVNFNTGPNAGTPLDASLQAGTGSTDLIVGAYYYRAVSQNFDAFVNGQFQSAVKHKLDAPGNDFRPGNSATM